MGWKPIKIWGLCISNFFQRNFDFGVVNRLYFDLGGGIRNSFDWEGWGAKEYTFFSTLTSHFVNNVRHMYPLWRVYYVTT